MRSSAPTSRSSRRARDLTITVTPVLADQLEDAGRGERLMEFVREYRIGSAELDARDVEPELVPACEAEAGRYRDALTTLESHGGNALDVFAGAGGFGPDRARHLLGHPRRHPADRHPSRPPAADRDGLALPSASVRPFARHLAARMRLRAGPRAPPRRARGRVLLHRSVRSRARRGRAASDRHRRTDRVPDRLGGRAVALVVERLSLRPRLCGLPRQVAARLPALVDRRRALRPDRRRRARPRAGAVVRPRRRGPALRLPDRARAAGACSRSRSTPSCSATGGGRGRSGSSRS